MSCYGRDVLTKCVIIKVPQFLFVKRKKDGTVRSCIDYIELNKFITKNKNFLSWIYDSFDKLQGAKIFFKYDLNSRYHYPGHNPKNISKFVFRTKYTHYEFTMISFGLTNGPTTFMNPMNTIFIPRLDKFVVVLSMTFSHILGIEINTLLI